MRVLALEKPALATKLIGCIPALHAFGQPSDTQPIHNELDAPPLIPWLQAYVYFSHNRHRAICMKGVHHGENLYRNAGSSRMFGY